MRSACAASSSQPTRLASGAAGGSGWPLFAHWSRAISGLDRLWANKSLATLSCGPPYASQVTAVCKPAELWCIAMAAVSHSIATVDCDASEQVRASAAQPCSSLAVVDSHCVKPPGCPFAGPSSSARFLAATVKALHRGKETFEGCACPRGSYNCPLINATKCGNAWQTHCALSQATGLQ